MAPDKQDDEQPEAAGGWGPREFIEEAFIPFAAAAGTAAVFELRVRLLASNEDSLKREALKTDLEALTKKVCSAYGATDDEREFLVKCVKLRNKLLHLELSKATGRVITLGASLPDGEVYSGDLATGEMQRVSQTSTEVEGVYGWLLDAHTRGTFDEVRKVFNKAIRTLKHVRDRRTAEK